jgi:pyruvate formate lyase activating enzyme
MQVDPIEKKPLYHYHPGSRILSVGFVGCNLQCPFCQNWHISQAGGGQRIPSRYYTPEALIHAAQAEGSGQIAYTYAEPLVHLEYLLECMTLAREAGIANVLVSNGCISDAGAEAVLRLTEAVNIDLKCFSEGTYTRLLQGDLAAVLAFITRAFETGVHLEVTTLVVPGLNDREEEIDRGVAFLASLSPQIPLHLSAYHPAYTWEAPATDPLRLQALASRARETLAYVYTGNLPGSSQDTICPRCGRAVIRREGYRIDTSGLCPDGSCCRWCGNALPITVFMSK